MGSERRSIQGWKGARKLSCQRQYREAYYPSAWDSFDKAGMKTENKLARQKRAAKEVANILYASLQQFSKEEQERRMKDIRKIAMKAGTKPNRKPSKRSSTPANPRVSRRAARVR